MRKFMTSLLLATTLIASSFSYSFASDTVTGVAGNIGVGSIETVQGLNEGTGETSSSSSSSTSSTGFGGEYFTGTSGLENVPDPGQVIGAQNVSVDDLGNKLTEKGADIIYLLKIVGQYVCVGAFIISCITFFAGLFGNKKMMFSSVIGALISGVCYAAITFGEDIVILIASWAAS